MTNHGNSAPAQRGAEFSPELVLPAEKLVIPRTIRVVALGDLIGETFSIADRYVNKNRDLISYDVNGGGPRIMQYDELTGDYTKIDVYDDVDEAWNIEMDMDRGTRTRYGDHKIDVYGLSKSMDGGLYFNPDLKYETKLIDRDGKTGEFIFGEGIGPKRQVRALGVLALMQIRLHNLLDGGGGF